jgi:hypothetical protein
LELASQGTQIEILDNDQVIGTAVVTENGEWFFTFTPTIGDHQFVARAPGDETAASGVVTTRVIGLVDNLNELINCLSNPGIDRGENYIIGTCETLSAISNQLGTDLEDMIELNPQIADPDLVYPGQRINVPR